MVRLSLKAMALALFLTLTGCGGGSGPQVGGNPGDATATPANAGGEAVQLRAEPYRLASGDRVRVNVFRHEDLSGEFQLDGNGNFALPLVGEVDADKQTTRELEQRIADAYSQGYLVNPQVSVEVLNYRPFYILGEVNNPGSYEFSEGMTVINAVALASGFTFRADNDAIQLQRGGSNRPPVVVTPTSQVLPGDIITVPERWF